MSILNVFFGNDFFCFFVDCCMIVLIERKNGSCVNCFFVVYFLFYLVVFDEKERIGLKYIIVMLCGIIIMIS